MISCDRFAPLVGCQLSPHSLLVFSLSLRRISRENCDLAAFLVPSLSPSSLSPSSVIRRRVARGNFPAR